MSKAKDRIWRAGRSLLFVAGFVTVVLCARPASAEPARFPGPEALAYQGYYMDARGERVAFEPMYKSWFSGERYELYPLRAILEHLALFGIELGVYWYDPRANVVDWQFPNLVSKLTSNEAFRFDDNLLTTNFVFHPFAGASHYLVTRANGFGVLPSFAAAAASSAVYELVLEWREVVSVNDLIVTPFGGLAMGEFFYHLGNYINSEPPAAQSHAGVGEVLHQGAKTTLGLPRDLHNAIDDPRPPLSAGRDNLGLSSAYWHQFRVLFSHETVADRRGLLESFLGIDTSFELAAMPGFLRVGQFERGFSNGNFTSLRGRVLLGKGDWDTELVIDSHLFGHYRQDFRATPAGKRGHASESALGGGLEVRTRSWQGQNDAYGIVHLLRPTERVWLAFGPAEMHLSVDLAVDFASLHSLAYETYIAQTGDEGTASPLKLHGYEHTLGLSAGAFASLKVSPLEFGVRSQYGHYDSVDIGDRNQEQVTRQPHGSEALVRMSAYARAEPKASALSGKVELVRELRYSSLGDLKAERHSTRLLTGLGVRF